MPKRLRANPLTSAGDPQHIANRLMNGVARIDENDCWIWGRSTSAGYGSMTVLGKTQRTHVLAWWVSRGQTVPAGHCVCHSCDEPLCINPDHLFLGTRSDNMRDMVEKGRHGGPPPARRGERNSAAKLSHAQVDQIRLRLRAGEPQRVIADDYDVCQGTISNIKRGLSWN